MQVAHKVHSGQHNLGSLIGAAAHTLEVYTVPLSANLPLPLIAMLRALSGEVYKTLCARLAGCTLAVGPRGAVPSMLGSMARGSLARAAKYLQTHRAAHFKSGLKTVSIWPAFSLLWSHTVLTSM